MTETSHARSRRASLLGLILQVLTAGALYALAFHTNSGSLMQLAWFVLGGVPIWFALLLMFRQKELAALESLDLEALRRERAAVGGEALFGAGTTTGFLVAQARLEWMQRWLLPGVALVQGAFLLIAGAWRLSDLRFGIADLDSPDWPPLQHADLGLIAVTMLMLFMAFFARYASGLSRVPEWQLLRGGGSFLLGNAILAMGILVGFGAALYQGVQAWERLFAYLIPCVMIVVGVESLLNFVADFYRPRTAGLEPRAAFDSRLLALVSEPGGIAKSVADALNYQFGFQVSQTWFYQLLQRVLVPVAAFGVLVLWLLSAVVVVAPNEHAIVERWGRQRNADAPLGPGLHFKLPAPIERVHRFNTGQLQQFVVGYRTGDTPLHEEWTEGKPPIELWTDAKHAGREHFDFIVAPAASGIGPQEPQRDPSVAPRSPVHQVRAHAVVQFRIRPDQLGRYTQQSAEPWRVLRDVAWNEMVRLLAARRVDDLMGSERERVMAELRDRLARRADELQLGLEIVHVAFLGMHPEKTVAEAFRSVVTAEQEKVAEIRKARVEENKILSDVAGDRDRALVLARAINAITELEARRAALERDLRADTAPTDAQRAALAALRDPFLKRITAEEQANRAQARQAQVRDDYNLRLGRTQADLERAARDVEQAQAAAKSAAAELDAALAALQRELTAAMGEEAVRRLLAEVDNAYRLDFWQAELEANLTGLEGQAAVTLAQAQARRWESEMRAASEAARVESERFAFAAAPEIYRTRRYLAVLTEGLERARKYFVAFDPGDRNVRIRFETQDQGRAGLEGMPTRETQ